MSGVGIAWPVAAAVTALENLHDEQLLFPNRLGARTETGARFRDGRARGTQKMSNDLNAFRDWVNDYCARTGRADQDDASRHASRRWARRAR